jgi:hypothetical protein
MRTFLLRSATLLGLVMVPSCGGSDSSTSGTTSGLAADCQKVCDATASLKCPMAPAAASCVTDCQQTADALPNCKAQMEALVKCEATHPASDFQCDTDGKPKLKNGCDAEGVAAFGCVLGGA